MLQSGAAESEPWITPHKSVSRWRKQLTVL
jgi:hypothetical protein